MKVGAEGGLRLRIRMGMRMRVDNGWWAMNVSHILLTQAGGTRPDPGRTRPERTKDLSDDLRANYSVGRRKKPFAIASRNFLVTKK